MTLDHPSLVLSRDVRRLTGSTRGTERATAGGQLIRVRRGAYMSAVDWIALFEEQRMLAAIDACRAAATGAEPIFAMESAAARHGIPLLRPWPTRVHTIVGPGGGKTNGSVIRTRRLVDPAWITTFDDGCRATDAVQTAIDIAATRSLLNGIIAMSHIRSVMKIPAEVIAARIAELRPFRNVRRVAMALRRSVTGSDTIVETIGMVRIQDYGFALPVQQFPVRGVDGKDYEVDLGWHEGALLAEIEGLAKYEIGGDPMARMLEEKRREDAIRPTCDRFIRLDWRACWVGAGLERALTTIGVPRPGPTRPLTY